MRLCSILTLRSMASSSSVSKNLEHIVRQMTRVYESSDVASRAADPPRLVAVSKTKPKELVIEAYNAGQRHFGENYVQELVEKSSDPEIREKCPDISWHFIGNCQTNKAGKVAQTHNLKTVETVTTVKLADKLQSSCSGLSKSIDVMVQVNTSGEASKNGVEPEEALSLVRHLVDKCPNLKFTGLMTIGELGHSLATEHAEGANPDFLRLIECRKKVAEELKVAEKSLELSMGMSNDFEEAIRMGSTNLRVGSSIFGERNYATATDVKP